MIKSLDELFADESCPKLLYMHLIKFIQYSEVYIEEIADVFARYFEKF